jgi:uncharacterized SAM-binding protein YcdF (DUF218 family)
MELTPFLFGLYKLVKYGLYPLSWVFLLLGGTTCLLLLPSTPGRLRWARIGAVSSFVVLLLISSPIVAGQLLGSLEDWYPIPSSPPEKRYDAIVVLGGGVLEQGTLRPVTDLTSYSRNRTTCGVDLYQQGFSDKLVLSGGDGLVFRSGPKESLEMTRWAQRLGVPAAAILTEERSRTTYENAVETKRLLGSASLRPPATSSTETGPKTTGARSSRSICSPATWPSNIQKAG